MKNLKQIKEELEEYIINFFIGKKVTGQMFMHKIENDEFKDAGPSIMTIDKVTKVTITGDVTENNRWRLVLKPDNPNEAYVVMDMTKIYVE